MEVRSMKFNVNAPPCESPGDCLPSNILFTLVGSLTTEIPQERLGRTNQEWNVAVQHLNVERIKTRARRQQSPQLVGTAAVSAYAQIKALEPTERQLVSHHIGVFSIIKSTTCRLVGLILKFHFFNGTAGRGEGREATGDK
ncbi:Mitogen-activated protein kinase kinase kinase 21 [Frankliniella fusca]|uniref:Mitogen-activated protein kinase kinase kinase 21 n=1 Tax=Frankliniella fusca TaxID=407009 RepID=A0AAE1HB41_9NEOP|nr:Mitogen-activated protein kinase kinase kinase 21 [Frankliniella fusca]KAK3921431.1 Mitogen-activated protein kinase kinase kinase 21 [Frankliniella fusca]KAK3930112.1 Mitogen-activated protein kinase kinase kinase 21 [Frankliniella fusca]